MFKNQASGWFINESSIALANIKIIYFCVLILGSSLNKEIKQRKNESKNDFCSAEPHE